MRRVDHIHTLDQLTERTCEYNMEVHNMVFIDFRKAFDSIKHVSSLEAITEQGLNAKMVKIVKQMYEKLTAYIKRDQKGETFRINCGVAQGDPLLANLFNTVLEGALSTKLVGIWN